MNEKKLAIVCRCSDVTLEQIRDLIRKGYTSIDEIKRITRAGMGPCQGKTCGSIIEREIAQITGAKIESSVQHRQRGPIKGIKLGTLAAGGDHKHEG